MTVAIIPLPAIIAYRQSLAPPVEPFVSLNAVYELLLELLQNSLALWDRLTAQTSELIERIEEVVYANMQALADPTATMWVLENLLADSLRIRRLLPMTLRRQYDRLNLPARTAVYEYMADHYVSLCRESLSWTETLEHVWPLITRVGNAIAVDDRSATGITCDHLTLVEYADRSVSDSFFALTLHEREQARHALRHSQTRLMDIIESESQRVE
ncbi:MAG: hypothetical protein M1837_002245 [Sclerophora amabilis]|nr:MAG: hypothetical protein M1837_002245 [Sclerophora amabilis]